MVKVIEEKEVPKARTHCSNCDSLLEYGNADLHKDFEVDKSNITAWNALHGPMCFTCPVCGCKVNASWIIK
jgi:hypothetical protein